MIWRRFFHRARRDAELARDIEFHLEAETDDNIARGMPADVAREHARSKFGNTALIREEVHRMNGLPFFETLWQDGLYGLRQLRRSAGFTAVTTITLALGIGATTAIFSVVNMVLLRPLPYRDAGRLAWVTERFAASWGPGGVLGPDFVEWLHQNQAFQQIEGFDSRDPGTSLSGAGEPMPVRVTEVTAGFFSMLGLQPIAGRSFTGDDGKRVQQHVLLISENLWQSQFERSPTVLGRTVRLDNSAYTVIGVMPHVDYPQADVWIPMVLNSALFSPQSRPLALVSVIGRLKPNITFSQAETDLWLITHRIDWEYPAQIVRSRDRHVELVSLHELLVRNVRSLLLTLLGAVGFVFLIACANVANLSLARAAARYREFAIRGTLGAGRLRLVRQLLTESLLLAVIGSVLGLLCGLWSVRLLGRMIPPGLPDHITLDPRILGFAVGITILATLVFGLSPALAASRPEVIETLKIGGLRSGTGRGAHHLGNVLVVSEIALSLVLLIGAGLLTRSFVRLTKVQLGFNPDHVLTGQVLRPMTNGFQTPSQVAFFNEVLSHIRALPGVKDAGAVDRPPLSACAGGAVRPRAAATDIQPLCTTTISPEYFRTIGIPVLEGRSFSDHDSSEGLPVVILNRLLAREAFGDRDPIGQQIGMYGLNGLSWRTVVGVVAIAKNSTLEQEPWPEIFVPYPQALLPLSANFVLRTEGNPSAFAGLLRDAVQAVDRNQSVSNIQTLDEVLAASFAPQWFRMLVLGLFALLALMLAAIGVFGVMAYSVSQRTHEIGVRVALGAKPRDILSLAVGQGMTVASIGLGVGIIGSVGLTHFLSGFLYEVKPTDLLTFMTAVGLLTGTALLACYLPARKAARVGPLAALRDE
jgi:putative ABC transport system permease protein